MTEVDAIVAFKQEIVCFPKAKDDISLALSGKENSYVW